MESQAGIDGTEQIAGVPYGIDHQDFTTMKQYSDETMPCRSFTPVAIGNTTVITKVFPVV